MCCYIFLIFFDVIFILISGRHDCVSVINNFVQADQIKYYTKKHGKSNIKNIISSTLNIYIFIFAFMDRKAYQ